MKRRERDGQGEGESRRGRAEERRKEEEQERRGEERTGLATSPSSPISLLLCVALRRSWREEKRRVRGRKKRRERRMWVVQVVVYGRVSGWKRVYRNGAGREEGWWEREAEEEGRNAGWEDAGDGDVDRCSGSYCYSGCFSVTNTII